MKSNLSRILAVASAVFISNAIGYAESITKVPFTISKAGKYTFTQDLTYSVTGTGTSTAITVNASNVVIEFNGFTLTGSGGSANQIAIENNGFANVTVQNGTITGFLYAFFVTHCTEQVLRNLRMINDDNAVSFGTCSFDTIQNCFIAGTADGDGIVLYADSCDVVKNNHVANENTGCLTMNTPGSNLFIANQLTDCETGLNLDGDKYQGNLTAACTTPFTGGTAVGDGNN
jgi:hypothetical protein